MGAQSVTGAKMTTQTTLQPRRFNVDEYYKMGELGILPEGGCELLDGVVYMKGVGGPWRFSVDDYYKMAEAGILTEDERLELLNGEIIEMSPIGSRHAHSVNWINHLLVTLLGTRAWISIQNPLRLNGQAEPEPDVLILRWQDDLYESDHPTPEDVFLLIEVSDTTLDKDRDEKLPMYAQAEIPECWIVNLRDGVVEIYTDPAGEEYLTRQVFEVGDGVSPSAFPDISIPVDRIAPA